MDYMKFLGDEMDKIAKKKAAPVAALIKPVTEENVEQNLRFLDLNKNIKVDNIPVRTLVKNVASEAGIDPAMLYSSAWQEGMTLLLSRPDDVSEAYSTAQQKDPSLPKTHPIDGFYNYGLDTFDTMFPKLVKGGYISPDFKNKYKTFYGENEKGEGVRPAAFQNNADALRAKAAVIRYEKDRVQRELDSRNIKYDDDTLDFLTLASYNGGFGRAKDMMDELKSGVDIKTNSKYKQILQNIAPRLKYKKLLSPSFADQPAADPKDGHERTVRQRNGKFYPMLDGEEIPSSGFGSVQEAMNHARLTKPQKTT